MPGATSAGLTYVAVVVSTVLGGFSVLRSVAVAVMVMVMVMVVVVMVVVAIEMLRLEWTDGSDVAVETETRCSRWDTIMTGARLSGDSRRGRAVT